MNTDIVFGSKGEHVAEIQKAMLILGYKLPKHGVDSIYGEETDTAVAAYAADRRLNKPAKRTPATLAAKIELDANERIASAIITTNTAIIVDTRKNMKHRGRRSLRAITGITLHQTATCLLRETVTDSKLVQRAVDRCGNISTHYVILRNGMAVLTHDYESVVHHAQWFNATDVGIEIDGWFSGVVGDPRTLWTPKNVSGDRGREMMLTELQRKATVMACEHIIETVAAAGGKIRYIHAHRQTSASRISDPGQDIWQKVAIPIMEKYGLTYGGVNFFVPKTGTPQVKQALDVSTSAGPGYPIPSEWQPGSPWGYRQRPCTATPHE